MKNQLTIWIHSKYADDIKGKIKETVCKAYKLNESDIEVFAEDNGFQFMFDDETSGDIHVQIDNQGETHIIQVLGTFDWEVVAVYQLIQDMLYKNVEGDVEQ